MKTLRLVRNIALLFILVTALLASRPGVAVSHAAGGKSCGAYKPGRNCYIDANGNCQEHLCGRNNPFCYNTGCM